MALLFMDGFDVGDISLKWTDSNALSSSTTTRFTSGRSVYLNSSSSYVQKSFTASAQIFMGFAFERTSLSGNICTIKSDSAATSHLLLTLSGTGAVLLYRGGTQIAASTDGVIQNSAWSYIELWATIADAGGRCTIKINGATVIDFTGDTKNAGTSTNIDTVQINGQSATNTYIDDFYLCDATGSAPYNTFLGDVRVVTLSPTAAGSSTQLTPDSGNNYARVNEIPYSSANYVAGSTPALRDTYTMADLPAGVATVFAVQNNVVAKRTSTGAIAVKPAIKSGAGVYYGTQFATTTSDLTYTDLRTTDPNTSAAWTVSAVNNLESGLEIA